MKREDALTLLRSMTQGESLLRHARSVELVMEAYGKHFGEDPNEWAICGLLHDADYEAFPDEHPNKIVKILNDMGESKIAHAISAHYTKWGVPYLNNLDKALLASDELTGFIIACCQIRPDGITGLTASSVKKKLKNPKFAAKVDRDEIKKGIELLEVDENEHIEFIIRILDLNKEELSI
jgi:predicted hydrolase (HD superfamily)